MSRHQQQDTFRSFWETRVDAQPDSPFLVIEDEVLTYGQFDASLNRLAHGLQAEGVGAGDHVALLLPNGVDLLRFELAVQKLGAVMVPMIASSTYAEIAYVLGHCRPSHFVADVANWAVITQQGGLSLEHPMRVYVHGGAKGASDAAELDSDCGERPADAAIGPLDPMSIMYTSGSTGRPKGVVQPTAGFASAGSAIARRLQADQSDNFFSALPLFHTAAMHMLLAPAIAAGARFTLVPKFSSSRFWDQVRSSGGTIAQLMPTQLSILMTVPPLPEDRDHTLRLVFSHVHPAAFVERFGVDVCTTWAMTETSGMGMLTRPGHTDYAPQLIGRPMPDDAEVKVVRGNGQLAASGEVGELCFRHPHVMTEYLSDPTNTALAVEDGWVRSGDLCALDEQGQVYFHGRIKHVIKRAGENIAGEEVEFTIMAHPAVEECIVRGVEDPIYTEEVYATVVVRDGVEASEEEIARWCGERLAAWKVPRYISLQHEELPRLANGKTNRRAVNDAAELTLAWDRSQASTRATT